MKTQDARQLQLNEAVETHQRPLVRYATHLLGGDVEAARDAVQETFLKLWRADPPIGDGTLAAWLFKVCRNTAITVRRRGKRMTHTGNMDMTASPVATSAEEVADRREQVDRAVSAMGTLPDKQQEVLRLKFQNEFSYKQIADITGLTVSHVGVLIHKGVKTIAEQLEVGVA